MDRYAAVHDDIQGPGDGRPTAEQVVRDQDLIGKLTDKTILITGGTAGLGTESARVLRLTGAKVFITARTQAKGDAAVRAMNAENTEYPPVEVVVMELQSLASVRTGAEDFLRRSKQLNILMTNAGVMACPESRSADGFELQFATNHLAHFLLFQLLKPTLLASSTPAFQSRVVSLSSAGHRAGGIVPDNYALEEMYTPFRAYGQTKTANIYFANEIERRYSEEGLHALSLHPGVIYETGIAQHQGGGDDLRNNFAQKDRGWITYSKDIPQGTATQVWAAIASELEGKGGLYLDDVQIAKPAPEPADGASLPGYVAGYAPWIYDEGMERRLWEDSLKMVRVSEDH